MPGKTAIFLPAHSRPWFALRHLCGTWKDSGVMAKRVRIEDKQVEGIRIIDQWKAKGHEDCKHWLFRVWNPYLRVWAPSKAHAELADGWDWAEKERAKFTLGERRGSTGNFASLAADYVQSLTDARREEIYVDDVKRLLNHLVEKGVADLNADDFAIRVRTVLASMKSFAKGRLLPVSGVTRNRWLRQVRTCIGHGLINQVIRHDPLAPLKRFRFGQDEKVIPTFAVPDLVKLVDPRHEQDPEFLKTAVMVYTGMRSREAAHLRWEWIDWRTRIIHLTLQADFRTKRRKERNIPLLDELGSILEAVPGRELYGWVFPTAIRKRPGWKHYEQLKAYVARCGIPRAELHPHSTRHTWAGLMLATHESETLVSRALGHSKLQTTSGYADAELTFKRDIIGWEPGQFYLRRNKAGKRKASTKVVAMPGAMAGTAVAPSSDGNL